MDIIKYTQNLYGPWRAFLWHDDHNWIKKIIKGYVSG